MVLKSSQKLAASLAAMAVMSMSAAPLAAAELPNIGISPHSAYDGEGETLQNHRHRRGRRGGVDTGDVIAGVLVLGAIAAIASSASDNSRNDRRERERETQRVRYRESDPLPRGQSAGYSGIDNAVEMCVDQVERGQDRVNSVDLATRDASGWNVGGVIDSGASFSCWIDNQGRIRSVDIGAGNDAYSGAAYAPAQRASGGSATAPEAQHSDEYYARARAGTLYNERSTGVDGDLADQPLPAYPGGPLPGEPGYEEALGG